MVRFGNTIVTALMALAVSGAGMHCHAASPVKVKAAVDAKAAAKAKGTRLMLKQVHWIYGQAEVQICKTGARIQTKGTDYTFVCKAPDWDALLFSDKRKLVARIKFADWKKNGIRTALSIMNNQPLHDWPRTFIINRKYKGLDSALYAFPYRYENGVPADLKHGKFGDYSITVGVPVTDNVKSYVQALFDAPPADGLPLRFTKYSQGNSFGLGLKYNQKVEPVVVLDTLSAQWDNKPVDLSVDRTKGYKKVAESDIVVKNDDLSHVFDNLMNEDGGKKKAPK